MWSSKQGQKQPAHVHEQNTTRPPATARVIQLSNATITTAHATCTPSATDTLIWRFSLSRKSSTSSRWAGQRTARAAAHDLRAGAAASRPPSPSAACRRQAASLPLQVSVADSIWQDELALEVHGLHANPVLHADGRPLWAARGAGVGWLR